MVSPTLCPVAWYHSSFPVTFITPAQPSTRSESSGSQQARRILHVTCCLGKHETCWAITDLNLLLRTPRPPQISLTGRAEKQSDVFSFGILLVEVYRGVPPWIKTPKGFRHNKDFLNFPAGTPKRFLALVKNCLDRKAKKRPQFSEICDELQVSREPFHGTFCGNGKLCARCHSSSSS